MEKTVAFTSLGCDKNRVDSEVMLGILKKAGYTPVAEERDADIIVVNTCCFIQDALEESIETILELAKYKAEGRCKGLIVAGCLSQRYREEFFQELPEVDAILSTGAYEEIVQAADRILEGEKEFVIEEDIDHKMDEEHSKLRVLSTAGYYAYLKISEGCDNHCTYCIIPKLKGKHRSRTMESLVEEAQLLAKQGVKELIIVAQDTSIYGRDLYGKPMLHELLRRLCDVDGIAWIRLLYCYPETLTDETIQVMAEEPKICHYIDIPIQHGSDTVLKKMGRKTNQAELKERIGALRKAMPDMAIRTTLIVGFPQESEEEFRELLDFVEEMQFERLGVFTYSQEEGTAAARMDGQIDEDAKQERKDQVMALQKDISAKYCQKFVGKTVRVLVEGKLPEDEMYCGRTVQDAPDIDGMVFFRAEEAPLSGDFVTVKITEAIDYDLIGDVVYADESAQ